ncbi:phage tail protein [Algoriphagus sediminis]|uniref:Tail fiber protein n=1 Tax=Algoriphagus sediminis TaxID=3057113 RepID=A0ABT7Y7L0_9BACT|nr:tail fiber protein [Algoriphagus sediminis]MDN3202501.1 tail fiber protein [Algoriphagus sediminis]
MEGMIGEVRLFGGNFAPRSWALCQGQLLPISQNTALFSILGTIYGGDGRTTFALPDLRGRAPIGVGTGPGLSNIREGQKGGQETHTLNVLEMPSHTHPVNVSNQAADQRSPAGKAFGKAEVEVERGAPKIPVDAYNSAGNANFGSVVGNSGGNQSFNLRNPFLVTNYIICLQGIFPSRS